QPLSVPPPAPNALPPSYVPAIIKALSSRVSEMNANSERCDQETVRVSIYFEGWCQVVAILFPMEGPLTAGVNGRTPPRDPHIRQSIFGEQALRKIDRATGCSAKTSGQEMDIDCLAY